MSGNTSRNLILILVAVALYGTTVSFQFAYDDSLQILLNPQVTEVTTSPLSLFTQPTPPGNLFRPVTTLSYWFTNQIFGFNPGLFHATNLALYCICTVLVHAFSLKLLREPFLAFITAMLFVVHPLHVEAVANIIGRAEILSTIFVLLACLLAEHGYRHPRKCLFEIASAVSFLSAVLCKESSLSALPLIPLFVLITTSQHLRAARSFLRLSCFLCLAALLSLTLRYNALQENFILRADGTIWPENPLFHLHLADRFVPALYLLGKYLILMVAPIGLSADYSVMPEIFFGKLYSWKGAAALAVLVLFLFKIFNTQQDLVKFLGFWLIVTFSLTINLITPIGTIMGDRLAFLPSVAGCALITLLLRELLKKNNSLFFSAALILCGTFALLTVQRIPVWQNNTVLFTQTVLNAPDSPKAYYNLGVEKVLNDPSSVDAEAAFRKALELHPKYILPTRALADIMLARKDLGRLEYWYTRLLALTPDDSTVRDNLEKLQSIKTTKP